MKKTKRINECENPYYGRRKNTRGQGRIKKSVTLTMKRTTREGERATFENE